MTAAKRPRHRPPILDAATSRARSVKKSWTALFVTLTCLAVTDAVGGGDGGSFLVVSEMMVPPAVDREQDDSERARPRPDGDDSNSDGRQETTTNSRGDSFAEATRGRAQESDSFTLPVANRKDAESASGGGGSSDTDGEDDHDVDVDVHKKTTTASASSSVSQPLRTLKRLQAMLDDSDYATSAFSPASLSTTDTRPIDATATTTTTTAPSSSSSAGNSPEKLWTRQDRAKYRRTRRAEKQRRDYNEQYRAQQLRELERERIVRQERERKELEDLRRKQLEVLELQRREAQQRDAEMQRQLLTLDEADNFTEDETDTDGMGFELPNLPVYLSDGETDEFSDEGDDNGVLRDGDQAASDRTVGLPYGHSSGPRRLAQGHDAAVTQSQRDFGMPRQSGPSSYNMYAPPRNSGFDYRQGQQRQSSPPQHRQITPPYDYRPPIPQQQQQQQQQHPAYSTNFIPQGGTPQYQFNNPNQQQIEERQRRYEQQYAAWAQAAANGYYYPPPIPPSTETFHQHHAHQSQHPAPNQQYTSSFRPPYQTNTQPTNQGYAQPPPYSVSYPSFLPQQRAAPPPESQALQATPSYQRLGTQGFFSRDNQVTQEWIQQQHFSPLLPAVDPARIDHDQSVRIASESSNGVLVPTTTSPPIDFELQHTPDTAVIADAPGTTARTEIVSPLISSVPKRIMLPINAEGPYCELKDESAVLIAGAESKITFDSLQKITFSGIGIALLAYCSVSPRSLPFPEYNRLFLQNLFTVGLGVLPPLMTLLCVYDGKYNNINTVIGTFHVSFTLGYALAFVLEIIVTTLLRLGVFRLWEPAIFSLTPEVPCVILPWVLREKQYRPKRITLFACDFGASCIASPIIEEYLKLNIVQWTSFLPRNFKPSKKIHKGKKRRKKDILQPIVRDYDEVTNINCYVTQMMAASLGLKLFDTTRRILMYTKKSDDYKNFYAFCRGVFPIHELCGTMTALLLARRDVLGVQTPLWKIIGPAVFIHGMANFRGMKPIFKWGSSTPWSEMQLYPWKVGSNFTLKQLLSTSYAKIVWFTILLRVFGFCVKNYYLIGRQARKRVTTYSGKLYAFSAKLETDAVLKRAKE